MRILWLKKSGCIQKSARGHSLYVLCDTSSILMLLQIAPDMFSDPRFECLTIQDVYEEIVRTTKFKTKYPWIKESRTNIRSLPLSESNSEKVNLIFNAITTMIRNGVKNKKTDKSFDLSREDRKLIACASAYRYSLSSGDKALTQFAVQEFKDSIPSIISPLELINLWLEKGLIECDSEKQALISLWEANNEHPQPIKAKERFKKLTGFNI